METARATPRHPASDAIVTDPRGKLWPLWLFPALCFIGGCEYLDAITSSPQARAGDDIAAQVILWWALWAVPAHGVTVVVLRRKLKRLPTKQIGYVAALSVALTALVFGLYMLVSDSRILDELLHPSLLAMLTAPVVSPVVGLCAAYVLVRQWGRGSAAHAG